MKGKVAGLVTARWISCLLGGGSWDWSCFGSTPHLQTWIYNAAQLPASQVKFWDGLDGQKGYTASVWYTVISSPAGYTQTEEIHRNQVTKNQTVWFQVRAKFDLTPCSTGSGRRRRLTETWSSASTRTSWGTAGTGCMRTETTEHVTVIRLRCRSAGMGFPVME